MNDPNLAHVFRVYTLDGEFRATGQSAAQIRRRYPEAERIVQLTTEREPLF